MKNTNKAPRKALTGLATASILAASALCGPTVHAQSEKREPLFNRLFGRDKDSSITADEARAATQRFQQASRVTATPVAAPVSTPASNTSVEPVARARTSADVPKAAPVATPVATRPPSAIAEPVARMAPGTETGEELPGAEVLNQADGSNAAPSSGTAATAAPVASPVDDSAMAAFASDDVPAPEPLKPKFDKTAPDSTQGAVMEITSTESVLHNAPDEERMVEFIGDVFLDHPGFHLTSDRLEVFLNDEEVDAAPPKPGEDKPPFKRAIATGAMIKIERINPDGKIEVAFARRADYDGASGDMVLSGGPPQLQSGDVHVKPTGVEDKIYLLASGNFRVETSMIPTTGQKGVSKLVLPVKGDTKTKAPSFLPTNLDDVSNKRD